MTTHDPRFAIIPGWIVTDPRLKGRDLQVLCLLGRHTDKQGWCRRSQVKMAAQLDCARSTVQASLDRLADMGVVEKHEQKSPDGRDSAHHYRVIYDRPPPAGYDFGAWQDEEEEEENNILPQQVAPAAPPADISAPPAGPESAPPAGPGSAPINDPCLTPPNERGERDRASAPENRDEGRDARGPLAKAIEKAFRDWFFEYPTANMDNEENARSEWLKLSLEDRDKAKRRLAGWIASVKATGRTTWPAAATYLRSRKFDMIADHEAKAAVRKAERVPIKPFGPVWGGMRAYALGKGPEAIEMPGDVWSVVETAFKTLRRSSERSALAYIERKGITLGADGKLIFPDDFRQQEMRRKQRDEGFPQVSRLDRLVGGHGGERLADRRNEALGELCEPVKVGDALYHAWRDFHDKMLWPLWPDPGSFPVVWLPKGGPEKFWDFMAAGDAAMRERIEGHVHAAAE